LLGSKAGGLAPLFAVPSPDIVGSAAPD
jgi:hypothetical protein